jgi:hypothetical protein
MLGGGNSPWYLKIKASLTRDGYLGVTCLQKNKIK